MPPPLPSRLILALLVSAAALGLLASAIYVPSIPDIARELGVPVGQVQLTLTTFLVGFGASTLFVGALSDRFGRRGVLVAGNVLCAVASAACALADTIELLLIGRAVQAVGACAGMVVARAVVRDIFDRDGTARAMAALAMAATLAPILAPVLGGYIHVAFGWRTSFLVVAVAAGLLAIVTASLLPETNRNLQNEVGLLRGLVVGTTALLRVRRFMAYAVASASGGITFYSFVAAAPVILIDRFGVSPDIFGIYIGVPPLGFMAGSFVTSRLTVRLGGDRLIRWGSAGHVLSGLLLAGLAAAGFAAPWAVIGPLLVMAFSNGLIMPNAYSGGVSVQPHLAGAASGLQNFLQMLGAGAAAALFAALALETAVPLGLAIAGAGLANSLAFRWLARD